MKTLADAMAMHKEVLDSIDEIGTAMIKFTNGRKIYELSTEELSVVDALMDLFNEYKNILTLLNIEIDIALLQEQRRRIIDGE